MFTRRFGISLVFSLVVAARGAAQTVAAPPTHWVTIAGGLGPAVGAGYATFAERLASVDLSFPTARHQLALSIIAGWHADDVFCNVTTGITCGKSGPTSLVGGTLSLLTRRGRADRADLSRWSTGVGVFRLPDGLGNAPLRSGVFPAVETGVERPVYTGDRFAVVWAARAVVLPYVRGRALFFFPVTLGYRGW